MNKHVISLALLGGMLTTPAFAASDAERAMMGAIIGGAFGAVIGDAAGGRDGAIMGSAIGAATGTAIITRDSRASAPAPVYVARNEPVIVYQEYRYRHEHVYSYYEDYEEHHDHGWHHGHRKHRHHHDDD
ncbi:MAG: hypothetical protein HY272_12915 [Gammaproteobacteria bacterium]|nr:hypothetical protein [Gammaproteobacteria bacterium]